jgi:hypothetical protein
MDEDAGMSDFGFKQLAPGRYDGVVDKVRYSFKTTTRIVITYKIETPGGTRRLEEKILIDAPQSSVSYFHTTAGLARVEDILRISGMSLADADGLKSLPGLLEGASVSVVTRNQRLHGYDCPMVMRVEKP